MNYEPNWRPPAYARSMMPTSAAYPTYQIITNAAASRYVIISESLKRCKFPFAITLTSTQRLSQFAQQLRPSLAADIAGNGQLKLAIIDVDWDNEESPYEYIAEAAHRGIPAVCFINDETSEDAAFCLLNGATNVEEWPYLTKNLDVRLKSIVEFWCRPEPKALAS